MVALASHANAQPGQQEPAPQFQDAVAWYVGAFPWGVAAGDALGPDIDDNNPDGYPDLAITISQFSVKWGYPIETWYTGLPGEIWIYRNKTTWTPTQGGFSQFPDFIIILPEETVPCGIEWAQMDDDLALELVVAVSTPFKNEGGTGPWGMYVYKLDLQGQYTLHSYQATEFPIRELTVADFNNDGYPDVAAAVDVWEGPDPDKDQLYVSLNDQTGHLLPEATYELSQTSSGGSMEIVSGHFDSMPGQKTLPDIFIPVTTY